jgi:thiosulfate/3-mercaptopyruvate sulfurtransferase
VSANELSGELVGRQSPTLLDVRWKLGGRPGYPDYLQGHLPGAVFVDLETDLASPRRPGSGRHPLPELGAFQNSLRAWGVRTRRPIVVYDDAGNLSAARLWWLLRWVGLDDVRLLDGGLSAWIAGGYPISAETPSPPYGDVVLTPDSIPTLSSVTAAEVAEHGILLDARATERYRGESEPVDAVAGHIPKAISAPTSENLDATNCFLDDLALRERFAGLGLKKDIPVGVYCGSGVTAAHTIFALALAGFDSTLYPGSWSEWIVDPSREIATGPNPG